MEILRSWWGIAGAVLAIAGIAALLLALRLGSGRSRRGVERTEAPALPFDLAEERPDGGYELREQQRGIGSGNEAEEERDSAVERLEAEIRRRIEEEIRARGTPDRVDAARREGEPAGPDRPGAGEYRVWYGTNRKPNDPADPSLGYSGRRDRLVRHGHCDVFVPESHRIGSVGSSALRRLLTWTDDRLKLSRIAFLEVDAYWQAVARQIAEAGPGQGDAVVFIHGFNVSFEEAAIRAAQIGFDLGIGTMAFFSWPSKGSKTRRAYQSDGQTIGASEAAIADFLVDFARRSGAGAVHVIVHSMGNQGVLRAMNRIVADAERRGGCRFGQLILAAADVDSDTFETLAGAYRELAARTTLYVSERDLALSASAWFAEYPRVGLYPPVSVFDGIDTVSVSNVDLTLLGHGYVGSARDVLQDMHRLIFSGDPPPRFGLKARRNAEGRQYWEVGE